MRGVLIGAFGVLLPVIHHQSMELLSQYPHADQFLQHQPLQQLTKAGAMIRLEVKHLFRPQFVHPSALWKQHNVFLHHHHLARHILHQMEPSQRRHVKEWKCIYWYNT